jgi:hypothetical protein
MLADADNILCARTGPNTKMDDLFRRFWQPVLSAQLSDGFGHEHGRT